MIRNDAQLKVVREQLGRVEAALDSIRRDVKPQNEKMYHLMAESYIDMLQSLRAEIDAYLGIVSVPENATMSVSLEGEAVTLGRTSAGVVTRTIDTVRRGLQSVVEVLEPSKKSETARRRDRWIERVCDLTLVGVAPGSVQVLLGVPATGSLFSEEDELILSHALEVLFDGLEWAQVENDELAPASFNKLSDTMRQSVLTVITRLLPPRSGPVERVVFQRRSGPGAPAARRATLARQTRERVRQELIRLAADRQYTEVEGVMRSIDLDAQTFVLRERLQDLPDLPCEYSEQIEDAVKELLDCRVIVSGTLETSRMTRKEKMQAETIELVSANGADEQPETAPRLSKSQP